MKQNNFFKDIYSMFTISCRHIDSSKRGHYKVLHIGGRMSLEQNYGVEMQYMHHLLIFAFSMELEGLLHSLTKTSMEYNTCTILWQYPHEGIVVTLQNFVEVLIPSMWQILQYPHLHIPIILHSSIKHFLPLMNLKMSFNYI
jgi:hypothetical protein